MKLIVVLQDNWRGCCQAMGNQQPGKPPRKHVVIELMPEQIASLKWSVGKSGYAPQFADIDDCWIEPDTFNEPEKP